MPAIPPYIIEPIWEQFRALLHTRDADVHPLGCHRRRIPNRLVFYKLVQVLVFGCAYERISRPAAGAYSSLPSPVRAGASGSPGGPQKPSECTASAN